MARACCLTSVALLVVSLAVSGCEQATLDPTAPAISIDRPSLPTTITKATEIDMIFPAEITDTHRMWEQVARSEAGLMRAVLVAKRSPAGDKAKSQAELVRESARRGASALIVVPEDVETLAPALAEVRDKGTPILLMVRPVPVPGKPIPVVKTPPFEESAKALVAAALKTPGMTSFPEDRQAVILVNSRKNEFTDERVAALKKALADAKFPLLETVEFGVGVNRPLAAEAQKALEPLLEKNPKLALVLADEDQGLSGSVVARNHLEKDFILVGFAANSKTSNLVQVHESPAIADENIVGLARQAVHSVMKMVKGEKVDDTILVQNIIRSSYAGRPKMRPPEGVVRSPYQ